MVSSGNDGRENTADGINVLAANDDVIAVGALNRAETARAAWSQHGDLLDVYAPGEDVMVDMPWFYSGERAASGTSFAAPKVAGAVAIVQEAAISEYGQALLPSQFEYLLSVSAHEPWEAPRWSISTRWSRRSRTVTPSLSASGGPLAAHQLAGQGAGRRTVAVGGLTENDGGAVALGVL